VVIVERKELSAAHWAQTEDGASLRKDLKTTMPTWAWPGSHDLMP